MAKCYCCDRSTNRKKAGGGYNQKDRKLRPLILRRYRSNRSYRINQYGGRMVPVTIRQTRSSRNRTRLYQLPNGRRTIQFFRKGTRQWRKKTIQGVGGCPLFRRVPASRSHGTERGRDAPVWSNEAQRSH